jgi:putative phage-type endonuclease
MGFKLLPIQETLSTDALCDKMLGMGKSSSQILNVVNSCFSGKPYTREYISARKKKLEKYRKTLDYLLTLPKIDQRTEEWYAVRNTLITASEFAQALDKAKFGTQKQFYKKKCGLEQSINLSSPPLIWGIKYEPVASAIYCKRTGQTMYEFGLLRHPTIPFFGASPDGITNNGVMAEFKCPYARVITGDVPLQYYYQMQGQLSVCNLEECDYVECGLIEVDSLEEMWEKCHTECGIIIEKDGVKLYSPVFSHGDEAKASAWLAENEGEIGDENDKENVAPITMTYWVLKQYNSVRIYRDDAFLKEQFGLLENVWAKVCEYRQDPSELTKRKERGGTEYMFIED